EVRIALRMGIYQLRYLERVPARAAVNESVELVKVARKSSAAPLVNAVLRRAATNPAIAALGDCEKLLPPDLPPVERLGVLRSHPTWMVARWLEAFGKARTEALLAANNRPPLFACAVYPSERRDEIVLALEKENLIMEPAKLLRGAVVVRGGSPSRTAWFRDSGIWIQDEASQAIPLLLGVKAGERVLDLCAAPGGKTAALAFAAGAEGTVLAADLHPHRLREMESRLAKIGAQNVKTVSLDAAAALPFREKFQRILVDAPCSGTGTLGRNPEIRWRLAERDLPGLHAKQVAMLGNALGQLADGGRLLYSTCSLEIEENERVIENLLRGAPGVRVAPASESAARIAGYLAEGVSAEQLFDSNGMFHTFPPELNTDGFFACVLEKRES
ncbi:MAG: transcription antitermination factor NusB, partial [Candidatus Acidiferrales bacterium]